MKTLYLVRHAKSSWKDTNLPDHDRPLNKRGEKEVTLTLKDSEHLKISEYFDVSQETWSLNGFNQALDRAKQECERIVKMINPEFLQR